MLIADCSSSHRARIRARLLRWYERNKRDLPWRKTRDPYAIWVSETMLQQTQVATVLPYYVRFMERFPTIDALDRASLKNVLSLWSGLGYYRRAENLKAAAGRVVKEYSGRLPCDYEALTRLPGVGRYTASALMSIAFEKPYAAVDGNARRMYSRLFGLFSDREIDRAAQLMVSRHRPGDFAQAVMELGSTLCVPREPLCAHCPVVHWCSAERSRNFDTKPRRRMEPKPVEWPLVLVASGGSVLLHRRPRKGLLAMLWELPGPDALTEEFETLRAAVDNQTPVAVIRHAITNHRIRAPIYLIRADVKYRARSWSWVPLTGIAAYPLSALSKKAIEAARRKVDF